MTFFETAEQSGVFLHLLCAGAAAGALYDLMAPLRRRCARPLAAALDALWCLLAGGLGLLALIQNGEDRLRLYALLGMACGAGIYCLGIRSLLLAVFRFFQKKKARSP